MNQSEEFKLALKIQEAAMETKRLNHERVILDHAAREKELLDEVTALRFQQTTALELVAALASQLKRTKHCVTTADWRNEIEELLAKAAKLS